MVQVESPEPYASGKSAAPTPTPPTPSTPGMKSPKRIVTAWLDRPQVTNREALTVGIVGGLVVFGLLWLAGQALDAADAIDFGDTIKLWLAAVLAGAMLTLGLVIGARKGRQVQVLRREISGLEARTEELGGYTVYAEHLRDALADLRRFLDGELPGFSLRDFVENGLFEPAQRLLARGHSGSEIRFSVLHPDGEDLVMRRDDELFPALGHSLEGREKFGCESTTAFPDSRSANGKCLHRGSSRRTTGSSPIRRRHGLMSRSCPYRSGRTTTSMVSSTS